ncbi:uncharacterized protein LOC134247695 [Saccostrea cucullata]|uniref:uncharacterized protein LOC134247695 n=1 Tax=Saccostrea cuccullata TaxID=36930 RepID=UPI002ED3437B
MVFQKLIGISRDALQIYFDGKFPKEDLENVLKTNENDMKNGRYKLGKNEISILFPDDGSCPLSSTFDITILYKLLRNYGEDMPKPSQGWGKKPHIGDKKETDDLERVRYYRNMFCHATPETSIMEKDDFELSWMDLSKAIMRLSNGTLTAKINELEKEIPT